MIPPLSSASLVEMSMLEARNRMLQDGRLLQAQQAATLSGAYAPQKQVTTVLPVINFVSFLVLGLTSSRALFTGL